MQNKHLWVIVLAMLVLSAFLTKAQEQGIDTISVPSSNQYKGDLQLIPAQPSLQFATPQLRNRDKSLYEVSVEKNTVNLNINRELKYLKNITGDSSSRLLPVYPGIGDYQNFGGTLGRFRLTNRLALDYGAFISVQYGYLFSTKQIVLGSNFLLRYDITNKLKFQTWGQYVMPGNSSDPTFNMRTFFPTSNFGSGLQYDSNQKTKIKVGIEYQYDQSDKIWKSESGGKVHLKF